MINCRKEVENLRPYIPGKPVEAVQREYGLDTIVKLASNENPHGCSPGAREAVKRFLEDPGFYPDGNCTELREKLAAKYAMAPEQFIFGAGSDEVISMITKTYVSEGDEVITSQITFPQYKAGTMQMGGKIIEVPLTDDYRYDLEGILDAITDRTRIIFVANPNNPTGTIINVEEQLDFIKRVPADVLIVMDEAYTEYIKDDAYPDTIPLLAAFPNLMVLRTFSKMYGLAAMRVGYGIGQSEIIEKINRIRNPFNVTTPAQVAAVAALDDTDFIEMTYRTNAESKQYTYEQCEALGLDYIPSYGNFVMVNFKKPSGEFFALLQSKGYIVRPQPLDGFQRVSLGTLDQMKGFFDTVKELL